MKPKIKAKWLTALRSGDFKKTTGMLKRHHKTTEPGYCCLGVLCEISKLEHAHAATLIAVRGDQFGMPSKQSRAAMLDEDMREYAGITPDQQRKIATMNDYGKSFVRIADWIEKHL